MLSNNKNSNWKQLLDKMMEYVDIADPITNPGVLDYLMSLLMNSNDIQIFQLPNVYAKSEDVQAGYVQRVMNEEIMNKKELSKQIKIYFTYLSGGDQVMTPSESSNVKLH